jgi:branched-chain amino acid transport system substrate-binding protein
VLFVFGVRYGVSKLYAVIIAVVIVVAAVATVMYVTSPAPTPTPTTTPTTTPQVKEIAVGIVQPLSGGNALIGQQNILGALFAVDEINAQGGVKSLGGLRSSWS